MDPLIGQSLGKYKIERLLGEGGMGAVYLARDETLQRAVALKVMRPEYAQQPDLKDRFLQEARAAARLDHPGIVRVHHFGPAVGQLYIDMEYIPGDNLHRLLRKLEQDRRWVTLSEAIQIVQQIAVALDYAHEMGVLHRDIKPANIMLKPRKRAAKMADLPYQPVLTDLGLAKLQDSGLQTSYGVSTGGTPAYMSPEQVQGLRLDARSDVYALGVLLFELTTGQRPFPIKGHPDAVYYHTGMAPPDPRTLHPKLPATLAMIILRTLEKQPERRFSSAGAFAEALENVALASLPATAPLIAISGIGDLCTLHQQSLVYSPGPVTPTGNRPQDRIQVLQPDGTTYTTPIQRGRISIGRDNDNDLVLNDGRVSRLHVVIEFDSTTYRVIDQASVNGTYLGQTRLGSNTPIVWTPDKTLRIGDHYLFLQRGIASPDPVAPAMRPAARPTTWPNTLDTLLVAGRPTVPNPIHTAVDEGSEIPITEHLPVARTKRSLMRIVAPLILLGLFAIGGAWLFGMLKPGMGENATPSTPVAILSDAGNQANGAEPTATRTPVLMPTNTAVQVAAAPPLSETNRAVQENGVPLTNVTELIQTMPISITPSNITIPTVKPTVTPILPTATSASTPTGTPTQMPAPASTTKPTSTSSSFAPSTTTIVPSPQAPVAANAVLNPAEIIGAVQLKQPGDGAVLGGDILFGYAMNSNYAKTQEIMRGDYIFEFIVVRDLGNPNDGLGMTDAGKATSLSVNVNSFKDKPWSLEANKTYYWTVCLGRMVGGKYKVLGWLAPPRSFVFKPINESGAGDDSGSNHGGGGSFTDNS